MGTYIHGILGPFRGRIANIIGTFWKGRYIMRIRAANVTNPNTIPQQTQRLKWKIVSSFLTANQKLIKLGFAAVDHSITAFNSAMKFNIEKAISGTFPDLSLDLTKVKLSLGDRAGLVGAALTSTVAGTIKMEWDDNSNNVDASANDQVMIGVMDENSGEVLINGTEIKRSAGTANVVLPEGWSGRTVHVHSFVVAEGIGRVSDRSQVSESQYLGTVAVA